MKSKNYFVYSPAGCGFVTFETKGTMIEFAKNEIAEFYDYEYEEVEQIMCGKITHKATMINKRTFEEADEDERESWPLHADFMCNYEILRVQGK